MCPSKIGHTTILQPSSQWVTILYFLCQWPRTNYYTWNIKTHQKSTVPFLSTTKSRTSPLTTLNHRPLPPQESPKLFSRLNQLSSSINQLYTYKCLKFVSALQQPTILQISKSTITYTRMATYPTCKLNVNSKTQFCITKDCVFGIKK